MLEIFFAHRFVFEQSNFVVASSKKTDEQEPGKQREVESSPPDGRGEYVYKRSKNRRLSRISSSQSQ